MKYIITAFIIISAFSSCKKFLEEAPKGQVDITNYYKTEGDAISAVNSIYAYLNSTSTGSTAGVYHSTLWVTAGLASDEMQNNQLGTPYYDQISNFTYHSQNAAFQEIWQMNYKTITVANIAIERIPKIAMNTALRDRLVGEAKFLRGLMYFNLVRMFGEIPLLVTEQDNANLTPTKASEDAIYQQILADLTDAANILPPSYPAGNGRGRATEGAANALLAKVYLTRADWPNASLYAKKVIDSEQYELWEDFADVFKLANRGGKEAVFSVGFGDAGGAIIFWEVGQFQVRLLPPALSVEGVQNAQGWQIPTEYLYDSYDTDDRRRAVTFVTQAGGDPIRPYIQKYWDRVAEPTANGSANDFPVIRYADVLLMYAEAETELEHLDIGHEYINKIRKRARFNGTTYLNTVPDYSGLGKEALKNAIIEERKLEFVAEGQRWFDLERTGKLSTEVPKAKPGVTVPAQTLFPIPQREVDLNPNL